MNSPIELLRTGIQQGDWAPIVQAFAGLTGEKLAVPSPKSGPDMVALERWIEQGRVIIGGKKATLDGSHLGVGPTGGTGGILDIGQIQIVPPPKPPLLNDDFHVQNTTERTVPFDTKAVRNNWTDDGQIKDPLDSQIRYHGPSQRVRPSPSYVDEVCAKCGKKESVLAEFSKRGGDSGEIYLCDTCVVGSRH